MKLEAALVAEDPAGEFPGEIAGASLKHRPVRDHLREDEAKFPGEIAGASLKRNGQALDVLGTHGKFPGEIAGASLKHLPPLVRRDADRRNSPAKSPGPH